MNVSIVSVTEPPRIYVRGYVNGRPFLYREREQVASLRIDKKGARDFPSTFSTAIPVISTPIKHPSITEEEWRAVLSSLVARSLSPQDAAGPEPLVTSSPSNALSYDKIET